MADLTLWRVFTRPLTSCCCGSWWHWSGAASTPFVSSRQRKDDTRGIVDLRKSAPASRPPFWAWQTRDVLILLALLAMTVALALSMGTQLVDDAYITLRYARNLSQGVGFVYNSGEQVLGTTSPLYTLLLATLACLRPGVSLVGLARWVSLLADSCAIITLYLGLAELTRLRALAAAGAVFYALSPLRLLIGLSGMETALTMALVTAAWMAYCARRFALTIFLVGLGALARPEIGLLAALLLLDIAWQQPRSLPKMIGLLGLVWGPWLLFAALYFGSPVPHSITAKMAVYVQRDVARTLSDLVFLISGFLHWHTANVSKSLSLVLTLMVTLWLFVLSLYLAIRRHDPTWPFLAFLPAFALFYLIGRPLIFYWYVGPLLPALVIGLTLGMAQLARASPRPGVAASLMLLAALLAIGSGYTLQNGGVRPRQLVWGIATTAEREALYIEVAQELAPSVNAETVVAAPEIGALGYYLPARILDTAGLVSPEALSHVNPDLAQASPLGHAISPELIEFHRPDYIVTLDIFAEALISSQTIAENYDLIQAYPSHVFGGQSLLVYRECGTSR